MIKPLCRRVWRFLKKTKIEVLYDPEIPLSIHPEKTIIQIHTRNPMFTTAEHYSVIYIRKTWKQYG